ncbi:uncharacterized protein LOC126836215 [Adelges cooleyi]|uniref:uncharacterized protein LOC126836215 n=1 Tax=Adelges cooleyi TaxID=133065 RepID=UPI00217F7F7E|nr:uncharacterized protein LOC126836215 [Adelges cooleyi]
MRTEIRFRTNNIMPSIQNEAFENLNLQQLGEERRRLTGEALKKIIIHALDGTEPTVSLTEKCRFLGLWIITQIPNLHIKSTNIDPYGVCILIDKSDHNIKYRYSSGQFWYVDVNNTDFQIIQLKERVMINNYIN